MCLQLSAWKNENGSWRSSTPQRGASSCRGVPTARPCWVLDGGCTLGADAHDLLLSVKTRSFITHNLESLFYSAWAPMLLLSLKKYGKKNGRSVLWFQAKANRTTLVFFALPPRLSKPYHAHKCASISFVSSIFYIMRPYLAVPSDKKPLHLRLISVV